MAVREQEKKCFAILRFPGTQNEIQHVYTSLKAFSLFLFVHKDPISYTAEMDRERLQNKTTPLKRSASISPTSFRVVYVLNIVSQVNKDVSMNLKEDKWSISKLAGTF